MSTVAVHGRIETIAAAILDTAPALLRRPAIAAAALRHAQREAAAETILCDIAAASAILHGPTSTVAAYNRGAHLALAYAALLDVAFGRDRTLDWCDHKPTLDGTDQLWITCSVRYAGCPTCVSDRLTTAHGELATDTTCDMCDADHGSVRPRVLPLGSALVWLYTGPCCDELFDYAKPTATTVYRRVGRNEACPSTSGRKFKRCHGKAA